MISPALMSRLVTATFSPLGVGSPEGWLWATIRAAAEMTTASLKTSRGWTMEEDRSPMETVRTVCRVSARVRGLAWVQRRIRKYFYSLIRNSSPTKSLILAANVCQSDECGVVCITLQSA